MQLEDSMLEDRATLMICIGGNDIARKTRRGVGNLVMASEELYGILKNSRDSKVIPTSEDSKEHLLLTNNIRIYMVENFSEIFGDCKGMVTFWRTPHDGPMSIRYKENENGTLDYEIRTLDEIAKFDKNIDDKNLMAKASDYFIKLL